MKRISLIVCLFLLCFSAKAQKIEYKFGKVSNAELEMKSYEKDKDAEALVLCENIKVYYDVRPTRIQLITEVFKRIKILKESGKSYADFAIPYRKNTKVMDYISGFNVISYNLVNGKAHKTSVDNKLIFDEEVIEDRYLKKFSASNVKEGTVVELKYKVSSDYYWDIPAINVQHEIPTLHGEYSVSIPEYLGYTLNTRGFIPLNLDKQIGRSTIPLTSPTVSYSCSEFYLNQDNVPGLNKADHVWYLDDFRAGLDFEITKIQFNGYNENVSRDWKDVNSFLKDASFGSDIKMKNPFKEEVAAIKSQGKSDQETITAIMDLVNSKINWDGTRTLTSKSVSAAIKKKSGNSADKNFVLAAALREAGYNVVPILLNPRKLGRLTRTRASIDKINTFILGVQLDASNIIYLDGADEHSSYNVIPTELLVDYARTYVPNEAGVGIDLIGNKKSMNVVSINASFNENKELEGSLKRVYSNQLAYEFSQEYSSYKNQEEYKAKNEKKYGFEIDSLSVKNLNSPRCNEEFKFKKGVDCTDSLIYMNVTLVPLISENPFKEIDRKIPIEFDNLESYKINCTVKVPDGYKLVEAPESQKYTACNKSLDAMVVTQLVGSTVHIRVEFNNNRIIYPSTDYGDLSKFFAELANLSESRIVFKKL